MVRIGSTDLLNRANERTKKWHQSREFYFPQRLINDVVIITSEHSVTRTPTKELADVNTEGKSIRHRATIIFICVSNVCATCVAEKERKKKRKRKK